MLSIVLDMVPLPLPNKESYIDGTMMIGHTCVCVCVCVGLGDIENTTLRILQQNHCDYCHNIALEYFTIKTGHCTCVPLY